MKRNLIILLVILSIFLIGCQGIDVSKISDDDLNRISGAAIVCNDPYIRFGSGCCLDENSNNICDNDEVVKTSEVETQKQINNVNTVETSERKFREKIVKDQVILIEFADFECPFCGRFYTETLPAIEDEYINKGLVKFEVRHYPLSFHPNAQKAAESAECAREQGKFWEMHDLLFEQGVQGGVTAFKQYAQQLGLDTGKFDTCLDSGAMVAEVQKDIAEANVLGIQGTPGFLVNSKLISGAQPFSVFKQVIDAELN